VCFAVLVVRELLMPTTTQDLLASTLCGTTVTGIPTMMTATGGSLRREVWFWTLSNAFHFDIAGLCLSVCLYFVLHSLAIALRMQPLLQAAAAAEGRPSRIKQVVHLHSRRRRARCSSHTCSRNSTRRQPALCRT
jgi:hypothetical protein